VKGRGGENGDVPGLLTFVHVLVFVRVFRARNQH
jgi:hypothetical protein